MIALRARFGIKTKNTSKLQLMVNKLLKALF